MSGMNETPSGERTHIGFFGRRNAGKSLLINRLAGQEVALVSEVKGTTTDPVRRAMEWLPLGPVVLTDTAGLDDEGELGRERVRRSLETLGKTDIAVLVTGPAWGLGEFERAFAEEAAARKIPMVAVWNRADEGAPGEEVRRALGRLSATGAVIETSALTGAGVDGLRDVLRKMPGREGGERKLVGDLVGRGEWALLAIPIDSAAPKGRLILPQQQAIREILDAGGRAMAVPPESVGAALAGAKSRPALVVTDSQAFGTVAKQVPEEVPLTGFSVLFARHKGDWRLLEEGAKAVDRLRDGDRILVAEGCTHHRKEDDIGSVKIPRALRAKTGKRLEFEWCSGGDFPADLGRFALVVHCGGCMLTRREMMERLERVRAAGMPVTNYGMLLAKLNGIMERALGPLRAIP